jgi:hypothetical protein
MVTCYPGNGARYIRHCDNPNRNGRRLTVLYYLNFDWQEGDGGELRIYPPEATSKPSAEGGSKDAGLPILDLPPRGDSMVLFFSDTRVPHEVLPAHKARYAVTHWFYDTEERQHAEASAAAAGLHLASGGLQMDVQIEEERLRREIAKFEAVNGPARVVGPSRDARGEEGDAEAATQVMDEGRGEAQERDCVGVGRSLGDAPSAGASEARAAPCVAEPALPKPEPDRRRMVLDAAVSAENGIVTVRGTASWLTSASAINVDVQPKTVVLERATDGEGLVLQLPATVDPERCAAKFVKKTRTLVLTLPISE